MARKQHNETQSRHPCASSMERWCGEYRTWPVDIHQWCRNRTRTGLSLKRDCGRGRGQGPGAKDLLVVRILTMMMTVILQRYNQCCYNQFYPNRFKCFFSKV